LDFSCSFVYTDDLKRWPVKFIFVGNKFEKFNSLFYEGIGLMIANIIIQFKDYWISIPPYVYILVAGLLIVGYVTYKEFNKTKNKNVVKKEDKAVVYYEKIEYKSDKLLKPLELKDYDGIPKTLIVVGKVDSLRDEAKEYYDKLNSNNEYKELEFLAHGFLKKMDKDVEKEVFQEINKFLG
jgi:acetyl esterase/lipase